MSPKDREGGMLPKPEICCKPSKRGVCKIPIQGKTVEIVHHHLDASREVTAAHSSVLEKGLKIEDEMALVITEGTCDQTSSQASETSSEHASGVNKDSR